MIIVFDFDKTLTKKDTLFGFFLECSRNDLFIPIKLILWLISVILNQARVISNTSFKKICVLIFIKGKSKQEINRCSLRYAKKIKFNKIYHSIFIKKNNPYIVSASFRDYIRPLFPKNRIVCSELEYRKNFVTRLKKNCYGIQKKKELNRLGIYEIDELYTDSFSDLPLAKISKNVYLVNGDNIKKVTIDN